MWLFCFSSISKVARVSRIFHVERSIITHVVMRIVLYAFLFVTKWDSVLKNQAVARNGHYRRTRWSWIILPDFNWYLQHYAHFSSNSNFFCFPKQAIAQTSGHMIELFQSENTHSEPLLNVYRKFFRNFHGVNTNTIQSFQMVCPGSGSISWLCLICLRYIALLVPG